MACHHRVSDPRLHRHTDDGDMAHRVRGRGGTSRDRLETGRTRHAPRPPVAPSIAPGGSTAIPFAVPPADLESQMNPAPSIGYRDRKSSGWMRVMQSPRAFVWRRSENSENTRSAFGSRTRYTPRRPMSLRAESSPPPTTGIPSSSMRRLSMASTSRNRTANFDFASTPSSVDEYPRVVREPISRHADLRHS